MKTITKQVEQTFYVCEGCGRESLFYLRDCLECKRRLAAMCSHEWVYDFENYWEETAKVIRKCPKCRKNEDREVQNLTPAQAKIVWEMLEGEK